MTPTVRVLISVVFYSIANLILEKRLSQYSLPSLMILWEPVMLMCGIALWGYYRYNDYPLVSPEMGWPIAWLVIMAVTYFIADSSYVSAYTIGGDLFTVTSVFLSFPVVAGLMKMAGSQQYPSRLQVFGYLAVAIGVMCFIWEDRAKGQ